jgi:phosphatidate cytidylyltransferase
MLRTRLWVGAVLIVLAVGVLVVDQWLADQHGIAWYPFLFVVILLFMVSACHELRQLLSTVATPPAWLCYTAVTAMLAANWLPLMASGTTCDPWYWIAGVFTAVVLLAFLVEMAVFQVPGHSVTRLSLTVWLTAYLGLLPSFLAQLRWLEGGTQRATAALALTIFVPKCGDIGAYFTGRFLGRHPMAPILSPKKTWEGAAGGLVAAVLAAIAIGRLGGVFQDSLLAAGLGLALGVAGMLGDLAESLIKRDCQKKDASRTVPGFGGVLDVADAILFAAPVAYWWLK